MPIETIRNDAGEIIFILFVGKVKEIRDLNPQMEEPYHGASYSTGGEGQTDELVCSVG